MKAMFKRATRFSTLLRNRRTAVPRSAILLALPLFLLALHDARPLPAQQRFSDDFEDDLTGWRRYGEQALRLVDSGDPSHGRVLELVPDGLVFAVVEGSEEWGAMRIEADFLFPDDANNYLGLVYNQTETAGQTGTNGRIDFGSIYVKGNGSYLRANPWRDGNASRLLYEEYKTPLVGDRAVRIGEWQQFRAEVAGRDCHVYVGDMREPALTFDLFEGQSGRVGFKPRVAGFPVWLDNVRISSIPRLSYQGDPRPSIEYDPDSLLTEWEAIGPLPAPDAEIERTGGGDRWRPFATDRRGAVVTARLTRYLGDRPVAYFRTRVVSESPRETVLHISSTEELALWVNGRFLGFVYRDGYVSGDNDWNTWHDFATNPDHAGRRVTIDLIAGDNKIVVRSRAGQFAAGGFFARLEDP